MGRYDDYDPTSVAQGFSRRDAEWGNWPTARTTPIDAFADPAVAYDDAHIVDLSPEEGGYCDKAPAGQCEFKADDNFTRCIHCGKRSEL